MKQILCIVCLLLTSGLSAQTRYEANWASLDSRPNPSWYAESKFGIFISWGLYSVPSFSKVGDYAEWYWEYLYKKRPEYVSFHEQVYGKEVSYPDFAPMFRCELFDPDQWADVFKRSGAKYVVLTSKHHDGFCLWPSAHANQSWGRPWNASHTGPMRDLLGDLSLSVRNQGLKMGYYYSLYEWFNPLYTANLDLYVEQHLLPQFKDLVQTYSPSIIFSDGEWDHSYKTWRSEELLAWLYNESPCKNEVVVNDRWGKECRHLHGGYYTTEYGSGMDNGNALWEESRGMAFSYGYSRTERIQDYNTTQELLYMLIDIVSRGGNFLLDIGITGDGRIPVIMQDRLVEMGKWLDVNGDAIYGTTGWRNSCQWGSGKIQDAERGEYKVKYDVMKLTVNPDPGMAVKEIFFTQKGNALYAICPRYPKSTLVVKGVTLGKNARVELLGHPKPLSFKQQGKNLVVNVPALTPSEVPCNHAWTFKLQGIAPN